MDQVSQVKKVLLVFLVTLDCQEVTVALVDLDHLVQKEIPASQGLQELLGVQEQRVVWERWASQVHRVRRVYPEVLVGLEARDSLVHLASQEPKVNLVLLALDHLDQLGSRASQANQGSPGVQDKKGRLDLLDCLECLGGQVPKGTLDFQVSKVLLVFLVPKVLTVALVAPVSLALRADQERPVAQEPPDCLERRVRQVVTVFQDLQESRENQDFLVMVVQVLLVFLVCQVPRETPVFLASLALLGSLARREIPVSQDPRALQVASDLLGLQDRLCWALRDSKGLLDHPVEQVLLALKVLVDLQEVAALGERKVLLEPLDSRAFLEQREKVAFQDSRVPVVFPVLLV